MSSRLLIGLLISIIVLAGCAPAVAPASPAGTVRAEAVLVRAMTSEPANLDPQGPPNSGLSLVLPYLYDTLVVRDVDNTILPALASDWEVADDGLSITMTLRPGATFHDGDPVEDGGNLVGSGPFMLGEWQTGQSLTLVRNPDYAVFVTRRV